MIKHCRFFIFHCGFALVVFFGGATGYMTVHLFSYHKICCSAVAENCLCRMGAPSLLPLKKAKTKLDGTKLLCWQNIMAASHRAGLFEGGFPSENKSWLINGGAFDFFFLNVNKCIFPFVSTPGVHDQTEVVWWRRAVCDSWNMIEGPQPRSDPNGWGLLINIDGVFIGMAVGLNYSEGSGRHMGHLLQWRS